MVKSKLTYNQWTYESMKCNNHLIYRPNQDFCLHTRVAARPSTVPKHRCAVSGRTVGLKSCWVFLGPPIFCSFLVWQPNHSGFRGVLLISHYTRKDHHWCWTGKSWGLYTWIPSQVFHHIQSLNQCLLSQGVGTIHRQDQLEKWNKKINIYIHFVCLKRKEIYWEIHKTNEYIMRVGI